MALWSAKQRQCLLKEKSGKSQYTIFQSSTLKDINRKSKEGQAKLWSGYIEHVSRNKTLLYYYLVSIHNM